MFDPDSAPANVTQGKWHAVRSPKEEDIRRSGGIFAVGRREFKSSVVTKAVVDFPDAALADRMTTTEQIIWAHRVDKQMPATEFRPGATLRVYSDLLPASDGTAPFSIHTFNQITGGQTIYPRQAAIDNDHFVFTGKDEDAQTSIGREFRASMAWRSRITRCCDGIFILFPEQASCAGQFIPGADSHSRAYGARGAVGIGVGSLTRFGWATRGASISPGEGTVVSTGRRISGRR
jgi:hypothetical protein